MMWAPESEREGEGEREKEKGKGERGSWRESPVSLVADKLEQFLDCRFEF